MHHLIHQLHLSSMLMRLAVWTPQECEAPDSAALAELQQLRAAATAFRVAAAAGATLEQERLAGGVAGISLVAGRADFTEAVNEDHKSSRSPFELIDNSPCTGLLQEESG